MKTGQGSCHAEPVRGSSPELELAAELDKDGSLHYQLGTYYRKLGREDKVAVAFGKITRVAGAEIEGTTGTNHRRQTSQERSISGLKL